MSDAMWKVIGYHAAGRGLWLDGVQEVGGPDWSVVLERDVVTVPVSWQAAERDPTLLMYPRHRVVTAGVLLAIGGERLDCGDKWFQGAPPEGEEC